MEPTKQGARKEDDSVAACAASNTLGRWLHCGMAICLVLCLGFSLGMAAGVVKSGVPWALMAFNLHKFIGLNALLLVCLYIVWSAHGYARRLGDLFPWYSAVRLQRIARELVAPRGWLHMQAVPAMVQGLGLTAALVATESGLVMVLIQIEAGQSPHLGLWPTVHLAASRFLWGYLAIHAGAVGLHWFMGQRGLIRSMFALFRPDEPRSRI